MLASYELKENGKRTHYWQFLRLGTVEIQERNAQDQVVAQNLWNPTALGGIGGLLERTVGAKQYYHYDHNGNPVQTVNADGEVTDNLFYTPFGELISGTINHTQPFGHSTKRGNFKSGLLYFGYRFYVPHMERWLNRDPIGTDGGLNIYAYVEQNPIMYVDPKGLDTICGNSSVWIPDPDNPGHGKCRNWRDQTPQCTDGSCSAFSSSHNDACVQSCMNKESKNCISSSGPLIFACMGAVTMYCSTQTCDKCDDKYKN